MLLLSSCSQKAAFEELADGACSSEQAQLVDAHISAQIDAMAKDDWELAYSLASPNFRSNVGYASKNLDTRVRLIDGAEFGDMMGRYGIGVHVRKIFSIVDIDEDYFED